MVENVHQLRPKPGDSEKITINLGFVDLGQIARVSHGEGREIDHEIDEPP